MKDRRGWNGMEVASHNLPMDARFYVYQSDETFGPYTAEEVEARLNVGTFTSEDLFWCEGMATRVAISKMRKRESAKPPLIHSHPPPTPMPPPISRQTRLSVKSRILILGGVCCAFLLLMIIGAQLPEDGSAREGRNAIEWERQLREGAQAFYGPNWKPTKTDEAMLRSAAKVSSERLGPPPAND
jgi:GYF domain 2